MNENICFCIPARLKSSRLKNKLLLPINNVSCISHTINQVKQSKFYNNNIFIITDSYEIKDAIQNDNVFSIVAKIECKNGTERISKNLNEIPINYKIIVNIQGDEPFISHKNIDFAIEKHLDSNNNNNYFYTTLHEEKNDLDYLKSSASIKVTTDNDNNVLYYSRSLIPSNKNLEIDNNFKYKTFTGIYVFNRDKIESFQYLENTSLQLIEDCEQLKILEHGYKIKSFSTLEYNEISLNTENDYEFLLKKYSNNSTIENNFNEKIKIKFVAFDLDGVFTDGKIYVDDQKQLKCYNGKDSYGLKLLGDKNIKTGLITAHDTPLLKNMEHIYPRMDYISSGNYNKKEVLDGWKDQLNLEYNEIAYIGDDLPDKEILEIVGFSACPNDAHISIKNIVKFISRQKGGNGAVREFIDYIIENLL